jgi:hypothetical protein
MTNSVSKKRISRYFFCKLRCYFSWLPLGILVFANNGSFRNWKFRAS